MTARSLSEIMLAAFAQCAPDNGWAQGAIERLRTSEAPEVTAAIIDAELTQAALFTEGARSAWLRSLSTEGTPHG